jgi:hypothetical protein
MHDPFLEIPHQSNPHHRGGRHVRMDAMDLRSFDLEIFRANRSCSLYGNWTCTHYLAGKPESSGAARRRTGVHYQKIATGNVPQPLAARAQQPEQMRRIGVLERRRGRSTRSDPHRGIPTNAATVRLE